MPRFPQPSPTTRTLSFNVFSDLVEKAAGRPGLIPLHVGDTYRDPPPDAVGEHLRIESHPGLYNYAPVQGEPSLLGAVRRSLETRGGRDVDPSCLQIVAGATSGLSVIAAALFDPGDEVIVPGPYWPLIRGILASRGAVPMEVPFFNRLDENHFDPIAALEGQISDRTAAIYVNSPNNPTGKTLGPAFFDGLADLARRYDLWVIADEAYEELWYGADRPTAAWANPDLVDRVIACHTFSKGYGMAGARVGYVHGPEEAMTAIRSVQTFQTYCAPRPMQIAAARALTDGAEWVEGSRRLYARAGQMAAEALEVPAPEGGTFLFFDASRLLASGEDTMDLLARCLKHDVLLTPGSASGSDYGTWLRLCFTVVPPAELEIALGKVRQALRL